MFRALRDDLDSPFNFRPEDVFGAPAGNMNVVAAQELMQEVFASLGPRHPR